MVLMSLKSEDELLKAKKLCDLHGIETAMFYEPDPIVYGDTTPMGHTALATQPVFGEQRKHFRRYSLWKA